MKLKPNLTEIALSSEIIEELRHQSEILKKISLLLSTMINDDDLLTRVEREFLKSKDLQ